MTTKQFFKELDNTFKECLNIAKKKNSDYANSGDPFKNFKGSEFIGVNPARAILVRLSDKISRIANLLDREEKVKDEKIEDTINDAINYLAILKSYIKEYE